MEQQCSFTSRSAHLGAGVSTSPPAMRLSINSTTGSPVELTVPRGETVEGLRTRISQKLRLQTDRIVLLHRDRQLTAGKLLDLGVADGSRLTLVPVIEAGLDCSTARPERTLMDVLESLTEVQIGDFLSGRSPLTINLGVGSHVMYVQLQLAAQDVAELEQNLLDRSSSSSSSELQNAFPSADGTSTTRSTSSPALHSPPAPGSSDSSIQLGAQRPRTSFYATQPTSCSSAAAPAATCHHHSSPRQPHPLHATHTPNGANLSLAAGCPHASCSLKAATPVCLPAASCSSPEPGSPAPASTFTESDAPASATADLCKQPGAVIESLVSHSPGIFSGTFSGSLAPCSQGRHPRRGVAIILQILNDLLRAAYHHQGAPRALSPLDCPPSDPPVSSQLAVEDPSRTKSQTLVSQRSEHLRKAPGDESRPLQSATQENQALHCKLERLQFLMHQKRLRRRSRRNLHLSQTSHPYRQRHRHRP